MSIKNPKIKVKSYKGLTVDFCKKESANFILRGLRNSKDFTIWNKDWLNFIFL